MKIASKVGVFVLLPSLISGCVSSPETVTAAYGPSPILQYSEVRSSTYNYANVRNSLVQRAGYSLTSAVDWYEVTRAGFDYVDEQCNAYLGALYRLRRDRDSTKAQLNAIGNSTTAILGFTEAAQKAILITAASFGLAAQLSDNASSSLLFAMDPSDVQMLVRNQADAYRAGAAAQRLNYDSSNAAMEGVRGYLNLCLPVSIEAQVKAALQGTLYVARTTGFGVPSLSRVQTASVNIATINPTTQEISRGRIYVPPPIPVDQRSPGLMTGDLYITRSEMKGLQSRLCVKDDGEIGGPLSVTREAIKSVQRFNLKPANGNLDAGTKQSIAEMQACDTSKHQNTYEHLALKDDLETATLKKALKGYVEAKGVPLDTALKDNMAKPEFLTGAILTADNRKVMLAIQKSKGGMIADGRYSPTMRDLLDPYFK
ncbi:hypothetical protein ABCW43_17520 [Neorhizobium sp. IRAMC:178]|uniref:hypothetical protein n=1 Tax=Neorhizobium tunisiense TaxID=3144793 RepID=UPI0031F6F381